MLCCPLLNEQKMVAPRPHCSPAWLVEAEVAQQQHLQREYATEHSIWLSEIAVVLERCELTNIENKTKNLFNSFQVLSIQNFKSLNERHEEKAITAGDRDLADGGCS